MPGGWTAVNNLDSEKMTICGLLSRLLANSWRRGEAAGVLGGGEVGGHRQLETGIGEVVTSSWRRTHGTASLWSREQFNSVYLSCSYQI